MKRTELNEKPLLLQKNAYLVRQIRKRTLEQGRPRTTTARDDRHLSIIARRNREAIAFSLSLYLYATTGTRVSRVTVSRRLHEKGLFSRRPTVCVALTSTNRRIRLAGCRQNRDWSMDHIVLFTDESRFSLNTNSHHTFIWREPCGHATYTPMSTKLTIKAEEA
ncbi:HTH_Tnp_Tc3_2 domain-containing protein [Trichonephila clavipes]|nr:HTH_Tnp_Tc3_2 domain-containing protein [Trichonephila clavipes]